MSDTITLKLDKYEVKAVIAALNREVERCRDNEANPLHNTVANHLLRLSQKIANQRDRDLER